MTEIEWEEKLEEVQKHSEHWYDMYKKLENRIEELEQQIEIMKCCGNCARLCECGIRGYEECENYDKWELKIK